MKIRTDFDNECIVLEPENKDDYMTVSGIAFAVQVGRIASRSLPKKLQAGGATKYYKANCFKCAGCGEIQPDRYDEAPEPCQLCGSAQSLLDLFTEQTDKIDNALRSTVEQKGEV